MHSEDLRIDSASIYHHSPNKHYIQIHKLEWIKAAIEWKTVFTFA